MDISIKCQLSLSKKLRALIQEGETRITLIAPSITDGRGEGKLIISTDKKIDKSLSDFFGKETSIMLTPIEMEDIAVESQSVGSIFSSKRTTASSKTRTSIDKMAAIEPPERGEEKHSIKTQEEVSEEIPEVFEETQEPEFKQFVSSMSELIEAISAARNKISDIDVESIQDPRKRAIALENKERQEAIDSPAYIVNDKCANLAINDLGINLVLNSPFNLANVSARRLANSKDLKSMFDAKLVKFINPDEIEIYTKKAAQAMQGYELPVYSSPEEAEESMAKKTRNVEPIEIGGNDMNRPTDQEILLTNLTSRAPQRTEGGTVRTAHGLGQARSAKVAPASSTENKAGSS